MAITPDPPATVFLNPLFGLLPALDLGDTAEVLDFHKRLPGYRPTPLVAAHDLAGQLGISELWVKDESERLGLPAFKMLGASWAAYHALRSRLGGKIRPWREIAELRAQVSQLGPLTLATATDGNHGRAVARMASMLGLGARIYVPRSVGRDRIEAIGQEGAEVIVLEGSYDDALARCTAGLKAGDILASDTVHDGHEGFAKSVLVGYGTLIHETREQFSLLGGRPPDAVFVQMGVGSFAASVIGHLDALSAGASVIGVEPVDAACVMASLRADREVLVAGPHRSAMVGLNCGRPSAVAWPILRAGLTATVAIEDSWADRAIEKLASVGIQSGPSGAAGLAGLMFLQGSGRNVSDLVGRPIQSVLVINTEGSTQLPDVGGSSARNL